MTEIKSFNFEMYNNFKIVAKDFWESKAIPKWIQNAEQLCMVLQAWYDLGLNITQSLSWLYIVNWIVTVYGTMAWLLMKKAWYDWEVLESTSKLCRIEIWKIWSDKKSQIEYIIEEAQFAWLLDWWMGIRRKYPKDMLFWKCLSRARKTFCPDALWWMPVYEDYQEIEKEKSAVMVDEKDLLKDFEEPELQTLPDNEQKTFDQYSNDNKNDIK